MTKSIRNPTAKSPLQERSLRTHEVLLDAAETLLKVLSWEQISTVAIMNEAGVSNGAIYGRFKSKDDLLVALYKRHDERLRAKFESRQQNRKPVPGETIEQFFDREIDQLISSLTKDKWLLRAMGLLSRQKPDVVSREMLTDRRMIFEKITSRFVPFEYAIDHPDPKRQIELVVFFVSTLLREAILYPGPHFETLEINEEELKKSIKQMAFGFLKVDPETSAVKIKE